MKISLGADHAGYLLKEELRQKLTAAGHEVIDRGTAGTESTDYPDYALAVSQDVADGRAERGVLVCSTGVGMSIAANKVHGVRAALGWNPDEVRLTRQHNDINVLTLGAKYLSSEQASEFVDLFLTTAFEGGRHARRLGKIADAESKR